MTARWSRACASLQSCPSPAETQLLPGHGDFSTMGQELDNNFYIRQALRNAKAE